MPDTSTSEPQIPPASAPVESTPERRELFFKAFSEQLEAHGIKVAFAFIYDQNTQEPLVFSKGNLYQVTKAAVEFTRFMKHKLDEDLTV